MSCRRPWISILGLVLVLLLSQSSQATQILPLSTEQLADGSQSVVRGTVVQERSYWNDAGTRILTEVEIEVDQSFKGSAPGRVRVVQMGGVVGTTKMTVAGALQWRQGEEVVLFLETSLPGMHRVAGFSQGKYQLERDAASGELIAHRPALLGVELPGSDAKAAEELRVPLRRLIEDAGLSYQEVK